MKTIILKTGIHGESKRKYILRFDGKHYQTKVYEGRKLVGMNAYLEDAGEATAAYQKLLREGLNGL